MFCLNPTKKDWDNTNEATAGPTNMASMVEASQAMVGVGENIVAPVDLTSEEEDDADLTELEVGAGNPRDKTPAAAKPLKASRCCNPSSPLLPFLLPPYGCLK